MTIMVDTGAWYAICDTTDKYHTQARTFFEKTIGVLSMVTTDVVLTETWALLSSRLGRTAAIAFWQTLRDSSTPIITLDQADIDAAWQIMNSFSDQDFSFTDCTTFAVMERMRIERAFAFDHHFLVYRYGPGRTKAFTREPALPS
jgi:predicted nucleic acid-binding protein